MSDIFSHLEKVIDNLSKLSEIRLKQIHDNRVNGQNNPLTKIWKSDSMKKWWKEKKEKETQVIEDEKARREYIPDSCYCSNTPHPPCGFCESANYCEDCDIATINDECPECEKSIEK